MILSPQQDTAGVRFNRWLGAWTVDDPFFYLGGYAGTGKTTLVKYLASAVDGEVFFCAFTGKAALVLRQKGCAGARTIHSLIYKPTGDPAADGGKLLSLAKEYEAKLTAYRATVKSDKGIDFKKLSEASPLRAEVDALEKQLSELRAKSDRQPGFRLNESSDARIAKLIVVDECSMVDDRIGRDLLSFQKPILVLGDPAQLPPVMGGGFFTAREPHYLLTEVHRQARESGILRLATRVREGWRPRIGEDDAGDTTVVDRRSTETIRQLATGADQVLVGRNKTRHAWNARLRQLAGKKHPLPEPGDKLVCLRNEPEYGLLNGSLWECVTRGGEPHDDACLLKMKSLDEDRPPVDVSAHTAHFLGRGEDLKGWERRDASEVAYGYALTVHKSQGSQWPSVCVYDESSTFGADWKRHLYTAVTRAASKLAVVV